MPGGINGKFAAPPLLSYAQIMTVTPEIIVMLTLVCICSGFVDAISGGGGLLTVPAMLFAGIPPIHTLATNKLQSACGTSMACYNFARSGLIDGKRNRLSVVAIFIASSAGAYAVQSMDPGILRLIVPLLLVCVAAYVLLSPRMTDDDAHHRLSHNGYAPLGAAIGFYDGFFGPGTGTFFTASLVGLRGHGLTRATALTKLFNLTSNLAALLLFALGGKIFWLLGICMAAGSVTGAYIGSHTAMKFGARVIRPVLVVISLGLTGRLIWSYFAG